MKKKTFNLVAGVIGGVQTIAIAIVTFVHPAYAVQINAAVGIVGTAAIEVCTLFVKDSE